ncbi:MAG: histidine--tRNA ligase, partial [Mesorhizobium sp.]
DKLGPEGVRLLLGPGRWDGGKEGEGDFAKGAGLNDAQAEAVLLATARNGQAGQDSSVGANAVYQEGVGELATIEALVRAAGYGEDRVAMDRSVVRGLEYYTGPVFEAELLAEIPNEDGQ